VLAARRHSQVLFTPPDTGRRPGLASHGVHCDSRGQTSNERGMPVVTSKSKMTNRGQMWLQAMMGGTLFHWKPYAQAPTR